MRDIIRAYKRADNTVHNGHLRPCLARIAGSFAFAEENRVIGRGDIDGRRGAGFERFAAFVGVIVEDVEVLAVASVRPVFESRRYGRTEFR